MSQADASVGSWIWQMHCTVCGSFTTVAAASRLRAILSSVDFVCAPFGENTLWMAASLPDAYAESHAVQADVSVYVGWRLGGTMYDVLYIISVANSMVRMR